MSQSSRETALAAFRQSDLTPRNLRKGDFTLTNGAANERSLIASYEAVRPFEIRTDKPLRLMLAYHEAFEHDGATTAEQTYNLTLDAIETSNTVPIEVYSDGTKLTRVDSTPGDDEYSVDFSANQVTADVDTDVTLHVFYYANEGLQLEIVKEKPGTTGTVDEVVYDDITTDLFNRDQNRDPSSFEFNQSAYQGIVPEDWELNVYTNGEYGVDWDDSDTDTSGAQTTNDTEPVGAIIDIPMRISSGSIRGLSREVAQDIGSRK